jgi:hypothetical protein
MMVKLERRFSAAIPLKSAEDWLAELPIPEIGEPKLDSPLDENSDIYYPEAISSMDKSALERLVWAFSAYLSVSAWNLGIEKAKLKAIDSTLEALINVATARLVQEYQEQGKKPPAKETIKAQVVGADSDVLAKLEVQIETQAKVIRLESAKDAYQHLYDGVSRVITVRRDLT